MFKRVLSNFRTIISVVKSQKLGKALVPKQPFLAKPLLFKNIASLSSMDVGLISEFRQRFGKGELNDEQSMDVFLVRWIRTCSYDLDKAETMLRKSLEWRKENDMDNISSWDPPKELKEMIPIFFIGFDADNCPVGLIKIGQIQFNKIVQTGQQEAAYKCFDAIWERFYRKMKGQVQRDGTPVSQVVVLMDLKGFKYENLTSPGVVDFILRVTKTCEANYPEPFKKNFAINAGRVLPLLFAIMKPILTPSTVESITMYNHPSEWMPILQQNIPADVLPLLYGGNNDDPELNAYIDINDA